MLLHFSKELDMPFKYDLTQLQNREQLIGFLELNEEVFESVLAFDPSAKKNQ